MRRNPKLTVTLALLVAWAALLGGVREGADVQAQTALVPLRTAGELLTPDPAYAPGDVVRIQLQALAANDEPFPDAGIRTAYNFASPANRAAVGTLDRFAQMVRNPVYRALIGNQHVRYGRVEVDGDAARQAVVLVTEDAVRVGYVFVLARQRGGACDGCWMAEEVIRFEVTERHDDDGDLALVRA